MGSYCAYFKGILYINWLLAQEVGLLTLIDFDIFLISDEILTSADFDTSFFEGRFLNFSSF